MEAISRELTSPLAEALEVVGDRWTLRIVSSLLDGPQRFGGLQTALAGIAPNVLSGRLRRLSEEGLVVAQPYSERPRRFEYELTERGRRLAGSIRLLAQWGAGDDAGAGPAHVACGTALEAVWYCPTCGEPVSDPQIADLHYA